MSIRPPPPHVHQNEALFDHCRFGIALELIDRALAIDAAARTNQRSGSSRRREQSWCSRSHSKSDAANLGQRHRTPCVYLSFCSFVIVMPAVADSAANCTLSPTFTCFSIAGSWTRNTIVMLSSSISRLLIGPLVSVIFPAPASIFLTTPLTIPSWADAADEAKTESASAAAASLLSFIFFPFDWVVRIT